ELGAIIGDHLVTPTHRADRSFQYRGRGVLVIVAGPHPGLLADDALALHFARDAVAVGDDPVAREEPRADRTPVLDRDRVREHVAILAGRRLVVHELRRD